MADESEPPDDGDESGFRLPTIKLGRCMVSSNGFSDSGCDECVGTHYNWFARVSEGGKKYEFNGRPCGCPRYDTAETWQAIESKLRTNVNHMQAMEGRLGAYERWVLRRKENLLSEYDSAHTRKDPMDMPLEALETLAQ